MNAKDTLKEAQDKVAALMQQQRAIAARMGEIQESSESARDSVQKADAALDEAIRAELRGLVTQADVATAKAALDEAHATYAGHERAYRVARQESTKIDMELMEARRLERAAIQSSKKALIDPLEEKIRNNAKLRGELLSIFGLYSARNEYGVADWDLVIADIFPSPTDDEITRAIAAAESRLDQG